MSKSICELDAELLIRHGVVNEKDRNKTAALLRARGRLNSISFGPARNELNAAGEHMRHAVGAIEQEHCGWNELLGELEALKSDDRCAELVEMLSKALKHGKDVWRRLVESAENARDCEESLNSIRNEWRDGVEKLQKTISGQTG